MSNAVPQDDDGVGADDELRLPILHRLIALLAEAALHLLNRQVNTCWFGSTGW
jgi:hypothetical protein